MWLQLNCISKTTRVEPALYVKHSQIWQFKCFHVLYVQGLAQHSKPALHLLSHYDIRNGLSCHVEYNTPSHPAQVTTNASWLGVRKEERDSPDMSHYTG